MTRLVQLQNGSLRRVALVEGQHLRLLEGCGTVYELATSVIATGARLSQEAQRKATGDFLDYDPIYRGHSEWRILPPIDHPEEPTRCLVSGTGLTHLGSARGRQAMHSDTEELTDSMKMFRWGVQEGRPGPGSIGVSPEWFYKGTGASLRAHGEKLDIPSYAEDGGEEAEIACAYIVGPDGRPFRLGMAIGNEFSDHRFEKKNYLYLASSKLRTCALGPELVVDPKFDSVTVRATIERGGEILWSKEFCTGETNMCHSLQNIEHHHFKFGAHRRHGDIHVHFLGTDCLSFSDGIYLQEGDVMQVAADSFGRPLRNAVDADTNVPSLMTVVPLD